MWKCLVCFAGAKVVGEAKTIMTPCEIGINKKRSLHFANCHFDLAGISEKPPQGEMRHRFVGVERNRFFSRRSRRCLGLCCIPGVANRLRGSESIGEMCIGSAEFRVQRNCFPEQAYGLSAINLVEAV